MEKKNVFELKSSAYHWCKNGCGKSVIWIGWAGCTLKRPYKCFRCESTFTKEEMKELN